jgi:hypothetical protein
LTDLSLFPIWTGRGHGNWAGNLQTNLLRRQLSSLTLGWEIPCQISDKNFVGAPRSLTYLRLPDEPQITKEVLQHLPNIENIYLGEYPCKHWFDRKKPDRDPNIDEDDLDYY